MEKLEIQNTIAINAMPAKVWDALVNPEQTKKYMFGCETVSDWQPGSALLWRMEYEGQPYVAVKGNIVEIAPEKQLVYTVFDPNSTLEDKPEKYLTVTYTLENSNGQTTLTVTQGDYNTVAEGERRYQESYNNGEGWNPILVQIKEVAEKS
jgi:uncharacterized protein YndB with AHSA1/START domain